MSALPAIVDPFQMAQEAVWDTLADPQIGFNAGLADRARELNGTRFAFEPYTIDWTLPGSESFMLAQLDPEMVEVSQWIKVWPAATLYGVESITENSVKFTTFSGTLALGLDFWLMYRGLKEIRTYGNDLDTRGNYESVGSASLAVADSLLRHSSRLRDVGVVLGNRVSGKAPVQIEGDGWAQRCTLALEVRIHE